MQAPQTGQTTDPAIQVGIGKGADADAVIPQSVGSSVSLEDAEEAAFTRAFHQLNPPGQPADPAAASVSPTPPASHQPPAQPATYPQGPQPPAQPQQQFAQPATPPSDPSGGIDGRYELARAKQVLGRDGITGAAFDAVVASYNGDMNALRAHVATRADHHAQRDRAYTMAMQQRSRGNEPSPPATTPPALPADVAQSVSDLREQGFDDMADTIERQFREHAGGVAGPPVSTPSEQAVYPPTAQQPPAAADSVESIAARPEFRRSFDRLSHRYPQLSDPAMQVEVLALARRMDEDNMFDQTSTIDDVVDAAAQVRFGSPVPAGHVAQVRAQSAMNGFPSATSQSIAAQPATTMSIPDAEMRAFDLLQQGHTPEQVNAQFQRWIGA